MARRWTCTSCKRLNDRVGGRRTCAYCGKGKAPKVRVPRHAQTLRDHPYEHYVEVARALHGVRDESCCVEVCRKPRGQHRRHDRDHDHTTGKPRGLLCVRHNQMLDSRTSPAELRSLADYLDRAAGYDHIFEEAA